MTPDFEEIDFTHFVECWQCGGLGLLAGCFEDCCSGADCDPEDAENCCAPSRCDICHGKGGWDHNDEETKAPAALTAGKHTGGGGA